MKRTRLIFLIFILAVMWAAGCKTDDGMLTDSGESAINFDGASSDDVMIADTDKNVDGTQLVNENAGNDVLVDDSADGNNREVTDLKDDAARSNGELFIPKLRVSGTGLVDSDGNRVQLYGVSTHGINRYTDFVNMESFRTLRDDWGVNCIRLAMYTEERNGYCTDGNKEDIRNIMMRGVDYATRLNMYVIIDWHILKDGDPNLHKDEAIEFFSEMSEKYRDYPNVIYEICNEPNNVSWRNTKDYALSVIPVIKKNNEDAVIIVGTPNWCQEIYEAADDPIKEYSNIMYSVHFYANSHRDINRDKLNIAIEKKLPVFCSEFGVCGADGDGTYDFEEAETWLGLLDDNNISYCIWNLSNKNEASALISSTCNKTSGWNETELSGEGKWYRENVRRKNAENMKLISSLPDYDTGLLFGINDSNSANNTSQAVDPKTVEDSAEDFLQTTATASKDKFCCSIRKDSEWNDGTNYYGQYTLTLCNDGKDIEGWEVKMSFARKLTIDSSWCANYQNDGSNITAQPVDYNSLIRKGEKTEIGFIIKAGENIGLPVLTINSP